MNSDQLDLWQDEVDALPWGGRSPRLLAAQIVSERMAKHSCGVDNFSVRSQRREPTDFYPDGAQYLLCVSTSFQKEV